MVWAAGLPHVQHSCHYVDKLWTLRRHGKACSHSLCMLAKGDARPATAALPCRVLQACAMWSTSAPPPAPGPRWGPADHGCNQ